MEKLKYVVAVLSTVCIANGYAANPVSKQYVDQKVASLTYTVGSQALGGTVFWVDSTGTHGLVAALADQTATPYGPNFIAHASGSGINAGFRNTELMIANQFATQFSGSPDTSNTAAQVCQSYAVNAMGAPCSAFAGTAKGETCYADWYLPSLFELNQLYFAKTSGLITNFSPEYWSSTENPASPTTQAYAQHFTNGQLVPACPKNVTLAVRCVRAF